MRLEENICASAYVAGALWSGFESASGMSFGESLINTIVGAFSTAVLVAFFGSLAAWAVTNRWQAKRQQFAIRAELVERVAHIAQTMYVACQHARRLLRETPDELRKAGILADLDKQYHDFSAGAAALETILGARYGVRVAPGVTNGDARSDVFWMWHQIWDLLTVYYFSLRGPMRDDIIERNSIDPSGKFHSGLKLKELMKSIAPEHDLTKSTGPASEVARDLRRQIRAAYEGVLPKLTHAILRDPIEF